MNLNSFLLLLPANYTLSHFNIYTFYMCIAFQGPKVYKELALKTKIG